MYSLNKTDRWNNFEERANTLSPNATEEPIELTLRAFFCQTCGAKVVGKDNYFFHIKEHLPVHGNNCRPTNDSSTSATSHQKNLSQLTNKRGSSFSVASYNNTPPNVLAYAETISSEETFEAVDSSDAQLSDCMEEESVTNQLLMLREWQLTKHGRTFRNHRQSYSSSPRPSSTKSPAREMLLSASPSTSIDPCTVERPPLSQSISLSSADQSPSHSEGRPTHSPCLSERTEVLGSNSCAASNEQGMINIASNCENDNPLQSTLLIKEKDGDSFVANNSELQQDSSIVSPVENIVDESFSSRTNELTSLLTQALPVTDQSNRDIYSSNCNLGISSNQSVQSSELEDTPRNVQSSELEDTPRNYQTIEDTASNLNQPLEGKSVCESFCTKKQEDSLSHIRNIQSSLEKDVAVPLTSTLTNTENPVLVESSYTYMELDDHHRDDCKTENLKLCEKEKKIESEALETSEFQPSSSSGSDDVHSSLPHFEDQQYDPHIAENVESLELEAREKCETDGQGRDKATLKPYLHKKFHHDQERNLLGNVGIDKNADVNRYIHSFQSLLVSKLNGTLNIHVKSESLCLETDKTISDTDQRHIHVAQSETPPENYTCEVCTLECTNRLEYIAHCKVHEVEGQKNFTCPYCSKKFYRKRNKDLHIRKHTGEKTYKCPLCAQVFTKLYTFRRHRAEVHSEKKLCVCRICKKEFSSQRHLQNHMDVHQNEKIHKCNYCDHACHTASGLRTHKLEIHSNSQKRQYQCDACKQSFRKHSGLKRHVERKHSAVQLKCDICSKVYSCNEDLIQHKRTHVSEPLKCDQCGKTFTSSWNLHRHKVIHKSSSHPYHCEICPAKFTRLDSLNSHRKLHTQEKPYVCHCGKRFIKKSQLVLHSDKHSSIPKYKCNVCNRAFKFKVTLKNHSCEKTINVTEKKP